MLATGTDTEEFGEEREASTHPACRFALYEVPGYSNRFLFIGHAGKTLYLVVEWSGREEKDQEAQRRRRSATCRRPHSVVLFVVDNFFIETYSDGPF